MNGTFCFHSRTFTSNIPSEQRLSHTQAHTPHIRRHTIFSYINTHSKSKRRKNNVTHSSKRKLLTLSGCRERESERENAKPKFLIPAEEKNETTKQLIYITLLYISCMAKCMLALSSTQLPFLFLLRIRLLWHNLYQCHMHITRTYIDVFVHQNLNADIR